MLRLPKNTLVTIQPWLARRGQTIILVLAATAALFILARAWLLTFDQPLSSELITAHEQQPDRTTFETIEQSVDGARKRAEQAIPRLSDPFARP
ncbi:MAG: hypothetical protein HY567_02790 [Candidatus Kerfeldbacteria bacterium]|nr:hypothetical protein [Candidatus Kerfeldbacteria bacterium]